MTFLSRFRYDLPPPPAPPTVVTKPLDTSSELGGGGVGSVGNRAERAEAEDSDDSGQGQEEPPAAAEEEEASDPPPPPAAGSRSLLEELQDTRPPVPHTQKEYQKSDDYMDSRADMQRCLLLYNTLKGVLACPLAKIPKI